MKIRFVYSGRNYDAVASLPPEMELPEGSNVDDLLAHVNRLLPQDRPLPASAMLAASGQHLGTIGQHSPRVLGEGDEVMIVAPVAGG